MSKHALTVNVESPGDLRHERTPRIKGLTGRLIGLATANTSKGEAARAARRGIPIMAYIGPNGSGKTLAAVHDTIPSLESGRPVFSTMPLYSAPGVLHPNYRPFSHWQQLLDAEHADFLADEIVAVASSREATSMHIEVQRVLNQLRKRDVVLRWTGPAWMRADRIIREVTWAVTECAGYYPQKIDPRTGAQSLWKPRQLFRFQSYDMRSFDEWSSGKRDKVRPTIKQWFKGPGSAAFATYNTLDPVSTIPPYDPGTCPVCGGKRRQQYCKDDHLAEIVASESAAAAEVYVHEHPVEQPAELVDSN